MADFKTKDLEDLEEGTTPSSDAYTLVSEGGVSRKVKIENLPVAGDFEYASNQEAIDGVRVDRVMNPAATKAAIDEAMDGIEVEGLWSDLSVLFGTPKGYQGVVSGQLLPGYDAAMILIGSVEEVIEEEPVNTVSASIASSVEVSMLEISGFGPEGYGVTLGIAARVGEGILLSGPSTNVTIANLEEEDLDDPEKQDIVGMTPALTKALIPAVPPLASKAQAEGGTNNTAIMTSLRVKQSIDKHSIQTFRAPEVGTGDPGWVLMEEYDRKSVELRSLPDPEAHPSAYSRFRWGVDLLNKAYLSIRVPDGAPGGLYWEGEQILTVATEPQAVAGTENSRRMTPLRTKQAIDAQRPKHEYVTLSDPSRSYALSAADDNKTLLVAREGYSIDVSGLPVGSRCWLLVTTPDVAPCEEVKITGATFPSSDIWINFRGAFATVMSTEEGIFVVYQWPGTSNPMT